MPRLNERQKGAVTVFFVIILMACFLFGGFFIDASRILVAKRQVKNAMNSAARSTLAYYDENLVGEYGLYGFEGSKGEEHFKKYFNDNLIKSKDEGIQFFKYDVEKITVKPQKQFNDDELNRQIVEYEKYRGPVNITIGVIDKFKYIFTDTSRKTKDVEDATRSLQTVKDNFGDKERVLSGASNFVKDTLKKEIKNVVSKGAAEITSNWVANSMTGELQKQYDEADKKIENAKLKLDDLYKKRNDYLESATSINGGADQSNMSGEAKELSDRKESPLEQMDRQITELKTAIDSAEKILKEVKEEIARLKNPLYDAVVKRENFDAELIPAREAYNNAVARTKEAKSVYDGLQLKMNIFSIIDGNTSKINSLSDDNKRYAESLMRDNNYDVYANEDWKEYTAIIDKTSKTSADNIRINELENYYKNSSDSVLKTQYNMMINYKSIVALNASNTEQRNNAGESRESLQSRYTAASNELAAAQSAEKSALEKKTDIENKIEEQKRIITSHEEAIKAVADKLDSIPDMKVDGVEIPNMKNSIKELADNVGEYVGVVDTINKLVESLTKRMSSVMTDDGEQVINTGEKNILTLFSAISNNITKLASVISSPENLRNEAYYIDYIMSKNTYLTSQTSRSHYFEKAEVEYIIFGFDSQAACVVASLGTIYGLRFVIDAFDYFITSADGELVSRIIIALGHGAVQAGLDMVDMLIANDSGAAPGCPISPSLKDLNVRLSYSDHLRLYLLLNSGNTRTGLRNSMSATLVEEKGGQDIDAFYTQVKADVSVKVNLLILPMIGSDLLPDKYFENGCYVIHDSIVEGYE